MHPVVTRAAHFAVLGPAYRLIRRWRVRRTIATYAPRVVEHSYAGHRFRLSLQDPLAEGWYDHDWGPQPEIELLGRGRLRPGARVFDLGAHQGVVALILAREVGETGTVIAVEAEPHNARVATENSRLNAADNLTVVHSAVSDAPGLLHFSEGLNGAVLPGGRAGKVAVDAVTIDGLAERYGAPDVVFVDVEGYEGKALKGAEATLDAARCDFFVEIHDVDALSRGGTTAALVVQNFTARGFGCRVASAPHGPVSSEFHSLSSGIHERGARCYLVALAPSRATSPTRYEHDSP